MALTAVLGLLATGSADANGKGGGNRGGSSGSRGGSNGGSKGGSMSGGFKGGQSGNGFKTSQMKSSQSNGGSKFGQPKVDKSAKHNGNSKHNWSGKFNHKGDWKNYHVKHGHKFGHHGWCFKGYNHCHWSSWCWNPTWGCYNYWCPSTSCYYYWYQPHACYYPLSYISYCAPVAYAAPELVPAAAAPVINIQNSAANAGGVAANNAPAAPLPPIPPGVQP
jgi:hypothetical protein